MGKHLSVIMLYTRSRIYKLLLILAGMVAVEGIGYKIIGFSYEYGFGQGVVGKLFWIAFDVALIILLLICRGLGEKKSRYGYTLQRLRISERMTFLWEGFVNTCLFLILWGVQIIVIFVLSKLYVGNPAYAEGAQGIFIDFYRSDFIKSIFPLDNVFIWIRNIILCFSAGITCALSSLSMRYGEKNIVLYIILACIVITFSKVGVTNTALTTACYSAAFFGWSVIVDGIMKAHNGKQRYEDEKNK